MKIALYFAALFLVVSVHGRATSADETQDMEASHVLVVQEKPSTIQLIEHILGDLHSAHASDAAELHKKRTCLFNGGLAHGCDYNDALGAIKEDKYWQSPDLPGKRSRDSGAPLYDGE